MLEISPKEKILLVGTGNMAQEYFNVLELLFSKDQILVIGRSLKGSTAFSETNNIEVFSGGVESNEKLIKSNIKRSIVATDIEELPLVCEYLLNYKVESILLEKPGSLNRKDLERLIKLKNKNTEIFIAYNRRFYRSINLLKDKLQYEKVQSFSFEFTEFSNQVVSLKKSLVEKQRWFLANSTHVVDLFLFLSGGVKDIHCNHFGTSSWHEPMSFSGSGSTLKGIPFSYIANWNGVGRWGLNITTDKNRYVLKPLEKLQLIPKGSFQTQELDLSEPIGTYKEGVYEMVRSFLYKKSGLCTIEEQLKHWPVYIKISGYSNE
jgi:hypothetical protein